jgi:hypothetical protein
METTKSIFASKTFWFNLVTLLMALVGHFTTDTLAGLGVTSAGVSTVFATILTVGNIVLRFLSDKPVSFTGK